MLSRYCWMKVECSIDIIDNQHDDAGGVDADVTDENGWTLLRTSSWSGQDQCVKTLLEAGAKVCCMIAQIILRYQSLWGSEVDEDVVFLVKAFLT